MSEKLDQGMVQNKKSIISEHYGFTPGLLSDVNSMADMNCKPGVPYEETVECEGCGKSVLKSELVKDFLDEMSCQGCRDVHEHFGFGVANGK